MNKQNKIAENTEEVLKKYRITISNEENTRSFDYLSEDNFEEVYNEIYGNVIF